MSGVRSRSQWVRSRDEVVWDEGMSTQDFFGRVEQTLYRILEGKNILAFSIRFEAPSLFEQVLIDIESNNCNGWKKIIDTRTQGAQAQGVSST